jgi:hypothetical protein
MIIPNYRGKMSLLQFKAEAEKTIMIGDFTK